MKVRTVPSWIAFTSTVGSISIVRADRSLTEDFSDLLADFPLYFFYAVIHGGEIHCRGNRHRQNKSFTITSRSNYNLLNLFYFNSKNWKRTASLFSSEELRRVGHLITGLVDATAAHDSWTGVPDLAGWRHWMGGNRRDDRIPRPILRFRLVSNEPRASSDISCYADDSTICFRFHHHYVTGLRLEVQVGWKTVKFKRNKIIIISDKNKQKIYNGAAKAVEVAISPKILIKKSNAQQLVQILS